MKTLKLRTIKTDSKLLSGSVKCQAGKYLPVSGGNMLVPFGGEAGYIVFEGERIACKVAGEYFVRSSFDHSKNARELFLDSSTAHEGQQYGSSTTTLCKVRVA